jgi:membrane-associated phospholipid phosphatase
MEAVFDFGLSVTRWLQANYPQLEGFFQFISRLGFTEFYLALFPLLYWCTSKKWGKHVAYLFLMTYGVNTVFKQAFREPRPYWLDSSVGLSESDGYGLPSGHVQLTAVIYPFFASWLRRRWVTVFAIFMIIAMTLSRIYLGVHFIQDALAGLILAALTLLADAIWQRRLASKVEKRILGQKLLIVLALPLAFGLIYALVMLIIGEPDTAVPWRDFIPLAERDGLEGIVTVMGALLGWGVGSLFEASRIRFQTLGPIWQRVLRYLLGMVVTVALWYGLGQVFPDDPLWLALVLRLIRYIIVLLWISYYAPAVFVWLKLAKAEPDPGISMSL